MKTRQDFIEADYVNGVFDENGNEKMRPLNAAEREWLSQFYAETEHGNFKKNAEIEEQTSVYKELNRKMRANKKTMKSEDVLKLTEEIDNAYKKLVHLRAETNTFYPEDKDRHEIYKRENDRNNDIYTVAKASNRLISFDVPEFDQFTSRAEKDVSPEDQVLDYLTKRPVKKVTKRRKKST